MRIARYVIASALVAAGAGRVPQSAQQAGVTSRCTPPSPVAGLDPLTAAGLSGIRSYARRLRYEEHRPPTGEERRLTVERPAGSGNYVLGPMAAISPTACSHQYRRSDFRHGAGRVVAMIELPASVDYPKLRLPKGKSYLWVDNVLPGDTVARGVFVPDDETDPVRVVKVHMHMLPRLDRNFAEARWIFAPGDDLLWESCVQYGCCQIEHGQPGDTTAMGG